MGSLRCKKPFSSSMYHSNSSNNKNKKISNKNKNYINSNYDKYYCNNDKKKNYNCFTFESPSSRPNFPLCLHAGATVSQLTNISSDDRLSSSSSASSSSTSSSITSRCPLFLHPVNTDLTFSFSPYLSSPLLSSSSSSLTFAGHDCRVRPSPAQERVKTGLHQTSRNSFGTH